MVDRGIVEILILGPVEARVGGERVPIPGAKQRNLLARLLIARGRPVSIARLCDEMNSGRPPRDPVHALQAHVSRLRAAFPALEIEHVSGGYRLDHVGIDTDISRFEKLKQEGERLLADGELQSASAVFSEALALWRGHAFDDVPRSPAIDAEAARLTKRWVSTMADHIDIDLALGREVSVIPRLVAVIEENILLERFWGQLMTALYREGQVQEALDAYARARDIFTEKFGMEPNGELGHLHLQILRKAPSASLLRIPLAHDPEASSLYHAAQESPMPSAITSNGSAELVALIHSHPALLLTGPAGYGKTHLLRSVQARIEGQHRTALFISGSALSQSTPMGSFAGTAGLLSSDGKSASDLIDAFARQRSTLTLLVDNADQLDDASVFVIQQLISTVRVPVVLAARSIEIMPEPLRAMYDSGQLTEVPMTVLSDVEMDQLAVAVAGGQFTPDTSMRLRNASAGIPRRMRELVLGSQATERLIRTDSGWELQGEPVPSDRLAQLRGERLSDLDPDDLEALTVIAIAGELPRETLEASQRRRLARTGVLALSNNGWLCLADPLDREVLRARTTDALWDELTRDAVQALRSEPAEAVPQAQLRAHCLALDLGDAVDTSATLVLAEQSFGAFDERLALRAAQAVLRQEPENVEAHRTAAVAASVLREYELAKHHFDTAEQHASSSMDFTAIAINHAEHFGLRAYDATRAVQIIEHALDRVSDQDAVAHLQRARMRWMAVAGMGGDTAPAPELPADAAGAMGLILIAMSGVITGPLEEAHRSLLQLEKVPNEIMDTIPGGRSLGSLAEAMAVSHTGDLASAKVLMKNNLEWAAGAAPESLGDWEYALGFSELLSGDAVLGQKFAADAVKHLEWRDATGLLPAAQALLAAANCEVFGNDESEANFGFDMIPANAVNDPKVIMLQNWTAARNAHRSGDASEAARTLVETGQWLLAAQHSYFAGMCAHYAVRTGFRLTEALAVLRDSFATAGGGFLSFLVRHAEARIAEDWLELDRIAREANELGLTPTASDSWMTMIRHSPHNLMDTHRQQQVERLYAEAPGLVSWVI